jgi:RNA polymerase sigma-70 factor, ECF subfamily
MEPVRLQPMETSDEGSVTELLRRYNEGDTAAAAAFIPLLYEDLRRLAHQRLRGERSGHTLGTTALVNEAYLRLIQNRQLAAADRNGFMAIASQTMRRVLVDYARTRNRAKRGGTQEPVELGEAEGFLSFQEAEEILALDAALAKLGAADNRAARVVELRFFSGL